MDQVIKKCHENIARKIKSEESLRKNSESPSFSSVNFDDVQTFSPSEYKLDMKIPRKECEADVGILLAHSLKSSLTKINTTTKGRSSNKLRFHQMIDDAYKKPLYSPKKSGQSESLVSFNSSANPMTPPYSRDDHNKLNRFRSDSNSSNHSSEDYLMEIDLDENEMTSTFKSQTPNPEDDDSRLNKYFVDHLNLKRIQHKKPKIDVGEISLEYNENMKREFPNQSERSEAQKIHRQKNTLAARNSRYKNKIYEEVLKEKMVEVTEENINKKREAASLRAYANYLMEVCIPNSKIPCNEIFKENFLKSFGKL